MAGTAADWPLAGDGLELPVGLLAEEHPAATTTTGRAAIHGRSP
jgi:hypothetical protein